MLSIKQLLQQIHSSLSRGCDINHHCTIKQWTIYTTLSLSNDNIWCKFENICVYHVRDRHYFFLSSTRGPLSAVVPSLTNYFVRYHKRKETNVVNDSTHMGIQAEFILQKINLVVSSQILTCVEHSPP